MSHIYLTDDHWSQNTRLALDNVSARYSFDVTDVNTDRRSSSPSLLGYPTSFNRGSIRHAASREPMLNPSDDIPLKSLVDDSVTPLKNDHQVSKLVRRTLRVSLIAWKFELCASILSICAMAALIILFRSFDNQPLSAWTWRQISLNAMIAIISTTIRVSSMLPVGTSLLQMRWLYTARARVKKRSGQPLKNLEIYDNASRGPLGSLIMLLSSTPRMSSLGAILTILALGFDVFSQQVLTLRSESVVIARTAGIRTVEILQSLPVVAWSGAVYNAVYSTTVNNTIEPCATGHCSWPATPGLGVCGQCNDIKSLTSTSCNQSSGYCTYSTPSEAVYSCELAQGYSTAFGSGITMDLPIPGMPIGNWTWFDRRHTAPLPSLVGGQAPTLVVVAVGPGSGDSFKNSPNTTAFTNQNEAQPPVAAIDIINSHWYPYNGTDPPMRNAYVFDEPSITQCGLWLCLQSRQIQTVGGNQEDIVVDTWSKFNWSSPGSFATLVDIPDSLAIGSRTFGYSGQAATTSFCASTNDNSDASGYYYYFAASGTVDFVSPEYIKVGAMAQSIRDSLESDGNLDLWIQRLSTSLSNQLRAQGNISSDADPSYMGDVYGMVPFIHIRWAWLAMPIIMVAASLAFLLVTIVRTVHAQVPAWKGSPLNTLFCRVDPELEQLIGTGLDTEEGVMDKVGSRPVALERAKNGRWIVKLVKSSRVVSVQDDDR